MQLADLQALEPADRIRFWTDATWEEALDMMAQVFAQVGAEERQRAIAAMIVARY